MRCRGAAAAAWAAEGRVAAARARWSAAAAWAAEGRVAVHPKDVGRVADEEEGLVPKNLLVEGEEEEEEEEEDDGEDVEGEVAQHRELGDREVGCVCVSLWGRWKGGGI